MFDVPPSPIIIHNHHKKEENNQKTTKICLNSSLIGRTTYIGFFIDWCIEVISVLGIFVTFISAGSFYVGMCLYINGMVEDMKIRMTSLDAAQMEIWSSNVRQIQFHNEILR